MKICTSCHQAIPERLTLVDRIRYMLAGDPERVFPPREIRLALQSGEATTYQTLRRMAEKGEIRKSTVRGVTGYRLAQEVIETDGGVPPVDPAESARLYRMIVGTVRDSGGIGVATALAMLRAEGLTDGVARGMLNQAVVNNHLQFGDEDWIEPA